MQVVELFGALWIGPAVAIVALSFRKPRLAAAAMLVTASKLVLERVVKLLVERQRPATSTPDTIARGVPIRGLAFVSGHVVLLARLAGVVSPYLHGRWKLIPWSWWGSSASLAVPRCTQPLDVVGGSAWAWRSPDVEPGARRSCVDADPQKRSRREASFRSGGPPRALLGMMERTCRSQAVAEHILVGLAFGSLTGASFLARRDAAQEVGDAIEPRTPFVIGRDDEPRRLGMSVCTNISSLARE